MNRDEQAMFQCGLCKRHFKRLDHLSRHVRTHTQSRPFQCHICPKAFTRADLLKRHVASHERHDEDSPSSPRVLPSRVTQACRTCASHHLRCSEDKPCRRCKKKGIRCSWNDSADLDDTSLSLTTDYQPRDMSHTHNTDFGSENSLTIPSLPPVAQDTDSSILDLITVQPELESLLDIDAEPLAFEFPDPNLLSGSWMYDGPGTNDSMELDDIDIQFLNNYSANIPFESQGTSLPGRIDTHCTPQPLGDDVLQRLYWRFRPNKLDHQASEEQHLSIMSNEPGSCESRVHLEKRVTLAGLGIAARDKILTIVVKGCRPENSYRIAESFPSVELLDALLQFYLTSHVAGASSFLHLATFDPNTRRPELVATMVAAGAALTADPTLIKLGLAIQEYVRVHILKLWEEDNTRARDLQLLQAFFILLEVGLWSGHSRKVEIAEGLLQPMLTMFRRDGKFKCSAYPEIVIGNDLHSSALEEVWLAWIESESYKRLAFRLLLHDSNCSMALLVNPIISCAELSLPLPLSEEIWSSHSAEHWKATRISRSSSRTFYMADFLTDPDALAIQGGSVDQRVTTLALISCSWRLCWEFVQLSSLQRGQKHRWNALVMSSRSQELSSLVDNLRTIASLDPKEAVAVNMRLESVLLHLHMQFEDIQVFAGLEGPEQARSVFPLIREWAQSESARRSVYHAAQILKGASELPRGSLDAIAAIMLYHASLAFLAYGLLAKPAGDNFGASSAAQNSSEEVFLDQREDFATRRFIQDGSGIPCLQRPTGAGTCSAICETVYLSEPKTILKAVLAILQAHFNDRPRPYLANKLIQLMAGLEGSLAR